MAGCRLRPVLTSKDLTVPNNPADVVMTSEIAEGQRTRLRVENQKEMQTNATCEQNRCEVAGCRAQSGDEVCPSRRAQP